VAHCFRVSTVSGVSGVSGVSDKFESRWLTVSGVSAGAVNYSIVDFLWRRNWLIFGRSRSNETPSAVVKSVEIEDQEKSQEGVQT
jgi:hypothetical protein